jgi:hypothetical protein
MKRVSLSIILLLTVLAFTGCKKESDDGGIKFSFVPNQQYQYNSLTVSLSAVPYGNPLASGGTSNVGAGIQITGIKPGNYFWTANVSYSSPQVTGSYSYNGEIIIEKGKIMQIALEE